MQKSSEPTSTEMPVKGNEPDDELIGNPPDGTKDGAEVEGKACKASRYARRGQVQYQSLPSSGKCKHSLSFPFWYCIFCKGQSPMEGSNESLPIADNPIIYCKLKDDLFICNACDTDDEPELMRSSGTKHTEERHLIRCLAPEKTRKDDDDTPGPPLRRSDSSLQKAVLMACKRGSTNLLIALWTSPVAWEI